MTHTDIDRGKDRVKETKKVIVIVVSVVVAAEHTPPLFVIVVSVVVTAEHTPPPSPREPREDLPAVHQRPLWLGQSP